MRIRSHVADVAAPAPSHPAGNSNANRSRRPRTKKKKDPNRSSLALVFGGDALARHRKQDLPAAARLVTAIALTSATPRRVVENMAATANHSQRVLSFRALGTILAVDGPLVVISSEALQEGGLEQPERGA